MAGLLQILGIALAPIVIIFTVIFMLDRHDKEPLRLLIWSFVLGILTAVPVIFIEMAMKAGFGIDDSVPMSILQTAVLAFVCVALPEEGFKYIVLRFYSYRKPEFNEPYDGIMYAVAVSMGFAAIENVMYVGMGGVIVGVVRMFTAVPAHGAFAHMMGYFVGKAKFATSSANRFFLMAIGLFLSVLSHGAYDFFLMYNEAIWGIFAMVVLLVTGLLAIIAIRAHRRNSPFKAKPGAAA